MEYINFAIDLGTTNSLIGKFTDGKVKLFKNPKGFKETLPSCVAFRKGKIFVGDKAKEFKNSDPENVFSSFKRKMGTDEQFTIKENGEQIDPIGLSTLVLNELKTFVNEEVESIVITIPASFDTIQSNSTKEAGYKAGFKEVVLLQEPIAACLSVFNEYHQLKKSGNWIIYDLGGGTFDVAIVRSENEELNVLDHLGNNFLGGLDFDELILKHVLIPELKKNGNFNKFVDLYEKNPNDPAVLSHYNYLLFQAELLKIELSSYPEATVDFELKDDEGELQDLSVSVHRSTFNSLIDKNLGYTIDLMQELMENNQLKREDIEQIILVGGSTYIPYVKEKIEAHLGIKVNNDVDPTNAICAGATFYAGNKLAKHVREKSSEQKIEKKIQLNALYENQTKESDAFVILKSDNEEEYLYRIIRKDLGYDSGKKKLLIEEKLLLPLLAETTNVFAIELYDLNGNLLDAEAEKIIVNHGVFIIDGQPLPHDICIEIDDLDENETRLELIFSKNAILPLSKTIYKTLSKNMLESGDDTLVINILEGDQFAKPMSNQVIGCISISPKQIGHNLIKDSDVEIKLEISESRDIKINIYISMIDFEVSDVFNPTKKSVFLPKLREEVRLIKRQVDRDLNQYLEDEKYELAGGLQKLSEELDEIQEKIGSGNTEIANDTKYHLEELKRQISVRYDKIVKKEKLIRYQREYLDTKRYFETVMEQNADFPEKLKEQYKTLLLQEKEAIYTSNVVFLKSLRKKMDDLLWQYNRNSVGHHINIYTYYKFYDLDQFKDPKKAAKTFETGDKIMERGKPTVEELARVLTELWHNLKEEYRRQSENEGFDLKGTGLN